MKILILGGTAFLGRYLVLEALARGHEITLFNRGLTNPDLFPQIEKIRGDRDGNIDALRNRYWDAVIDTSGYISWKVRASATLLADCVEHYTFVSSISVYKDFSIAGMDESGPLEQLLDGKTEDETDDDSYGARKALCEKAAEESMAGRTLNVRAGFIVGPYDGIDRFAYWVRRVAQGGKVLAPGSPCGLVQLIDVRDLAAWIIQMSERRICGTYNVTGPGAPLTFLGMLEACKTASNSNAEFVWVDESFLLQQQVKPFSELPFWLPGKEYSGLFALNCCKAFETGLAIRSLVETARDTLEWDRKRDRSKEAPKRATVLAEGKIGLEPEQEQQLITAWESLRSREH